jgi:hypothetical protein
LSQQQQEPEPEKKKEKQQQQYKAFAGKGWNARTQTYSEIQIYTLTVDRVEVNHQLVDYYEAHPNDQIVVTRADKSIASIHRQSRFPGNGNYIVVPVSLQIKRYFHIPAVELELLEQECKEEGIIYCGEIKGLVPIREILQTTNEELLLHPVIEDVEKTFSAAVATGVATAKSDSDMFTEFYKFPEKQCLYWDCPKHYGNLQVFKYPKYFLAGETESHPWVVKRNRLEDLIRFAKLVQLTTESLMSLDSISRLSEIDDDSDDYDDE